MAGDSNQRQGTDIGRQQLGAVYAKALLGATEKSGVTDEVMAEFDELIHEVFDRCPELEATLASLRVSADEKATLLDRVFGSRLSDSLLTFLKVVCRHNRLDCLRDIHREACRQLHQTRGLVEVTVTTAQPISSDLAGQLALALQDTLGREVLLGQSVDPDLIGGMVVRVGDKVYDGSVAYQLERLRTETVEKTVQEIRSAGDRFVVAE